MMPFDNSGVVVIAAAFFGIVVAFALVGRLEFACLMQDDFEKTKVIIHNSAANSTVESGILTFGARMYRPAVSRVKEK